MNTHAHAHDRPTSRYQNKTDSKGTEFPIPFQLKASRDLLIFKRLKYKTIEETQQILFFNLYTYDAIDIAFIIGSLIVFIWE